MDRRRQAGDQDGAELSADAHLPQPGEVLHGRFVVESWVAEGGMGSVMRARDSETGELTAVKISSRSRATDAARFSRESRMLAELSHPAIVRHIAHGTSASGAPFFVMEWLEGQDLSQLLATRRLSLTESVTLLRRVCDGVAAAHDRGIVHRDLKPNNIFLVGGDVRAAKVLDFGIARYRFGVSNALTQAGTLLGTVGYMSPEQAMGQADVDARADVFSLGCVLFECLTGRPVFRSVHDLAVLAKVLREEPPRVSELCPELGTQLDDLVARMLAKDRALRPLDARDLGRLLDQLEFEEVVQSYVPPPRPLRMTSSERRFASVVLARARAQEQTLSSTLADQQDAEFSALTRRFGAEPLPLQGGGLLLSLSGQGAATDQARAAALFALEVQKLRPHLHIAVSTGRLETMGIAAIGQAIDEAAALLASSRSRTAIAIDELSYALLDDRFDVERVADSLFLRGERSDGDLPRLLMGRQTPCVGRDKELALLTGTLRESLADSVARFTLVTAAPGIGKSRLMRAFLELARAEQGLRILTARADQVSADTSLWLAGQLVRSAAGLVGAGDSAVRERLLFQYRAQLKLADGAHDFGEFLAALTGVAHALPASAALRAARNDPGVMAEQMRRAFESWLEAELGRGPLAIVIDDAHWADQVSFGYLETALARSAERPLCVVALGRPELHERFPRFEQLSCLQEIRLPALTRRAATQLVRNAVNASEDTVHYVVDRGEGNAFYLEELARCVAEGARELPSTVLAMAQSRLDGLEPEARRVLRAASVFGVRCWDAGVSALLGTEEVAHAWLDTLADREIMVRRASSHFPGQREFEFRHALLRDAAYAMLTDEDRSVAHRLAGSWLEASGERDAHLLASHFERGGCDALAVRWLLPAALTAMEAGDFAGTLALAQRGLDLHAAGEQRGMLLLAQGYVAAHRGDACVESLAEALTLLPRGSPYWWLTLSALIFGTLSSGRQDLTVSYIPLALTTAPGAELTGPCGAALQAIAAALVIIGQTDAAWSVLDQFEHALRNATQIDPLFVAWFNLARCQVSTSSPYKGTWRLESALAWSREAARTMQSLGSLHGQATANFYWGYTSRILGLYEEAEGALTRSLSQAVQMGNLLIVDYSKLILTLVKLQRGERAEALSLLRAVGAGSDASVAHGVQAMIAETHFRCGELPAAVNAARAALAGASVPYRRVAHCTLARAQLALADWRAAVDTVEAALLLDAAATPEYELDLLATQVSALAALGQHETAARVLSRAQSVLATLAAGISDPSLCHTFLTAIESHARIAALSKQL